MSLHSARGFQMRTPFQFGLRSLFALTAGMAVATLFATMLLAATGWQREGLLLVFIVVLVVAAPLLVLAAAAWLMDRWSERHRN
jgi:hypothetical protein